MDKCVIFSVAGSGKTSLIIARLSLDQRALIITYTEKNYRHLRNRIIQKFGMIPPNITLMTYFSFLHGFCYRPLMQLKLKTRGINFRRPPNKQYKLNDLNRYLDDSGRLYHCRLAKLIQVKEIIPDVCARLERFYDYLYIDEVQDFAGHDFNLLLEISQANIGIMFVGDFYQHTFDTSRDGTINKNLHNDAVSYEQRFRNAGIQVDKKTLSDSWRCTKVVCDFISTNLKIPMGAHEERVSRIITVSDQNQANLLHADPNIVKLFLQEHYKYGCYSENWGASKGMDHFNDVCVVMGQNIWKSYLEKNLHQASPKTRNKLYVACTRARGDLYFVPEKLLKAFKQGK